MKDYVTEIFWDYVLSALTKKHGTKINDDQRETLANEYIEKVKQENGFTVQMTQAIIDKKGITKCYSESCNGTPVFYLVKEGMFKKVKVCYLISRKKEGLSKEYLEQIYNELRQQAQGENIFNSPDYKNG